MKKIIVSVVVVCALLFTVNVYAGKALGPDKLRLAPPHSNAFGMSLHEWMDEWVNWFFTSQDSDVRVNNAAFLPLWEFDIEVEAGTALVLPVFTYLGFPEDATIPEEWWGDPNYIWGVLSIDGGPEVKITAEYYTGITYFDPWIEFFGYNISFYQAIGCVILPLPPGEHVLVLHSECVEGYDCSAVFDNTWNINVTR